MKFNETQDSLAERTRTTNKAGGEAYEPVSPELGLYLVTINNLLEDKYYEDDESSFEEVYERFDKVADENPEFVLKLAYFAREEMFLRQIPQLLLVFAANDDRTKEYVREYATGIMQRADEPLEALAMQVDLYSKTIPHPLQKGIEDAMHQWDEYQYAKWDRSRREWRYRDLMALVHPKPRDDLRGDIFEKIVKGDLDDYPEIEPPKQHGTWEDAMSEAGQDDDMTKAEAYRDRLDRMPLKATVMQTRDMLDAGLEPEEILTDEKLDRVSDGKLWPFRYYRAYTAVRDAGYSGRHIDRWFEQAVDESIDTVPDDLGDTYAGVDLSGSMNHALSDNATTTYKQISALFGAVCAKKGAGVAGFATNFEEFDFHYDTPALQAVKEVESARIGMGTNAGQVIKHLTQERREYENVVLFTDMQIWQGYSVKETWDEYTSKVAPDANLYIVDLSSYGDLVMPEGYHNVFRVSGWNSNIIKHIKYADQEDEAIRQVEQVSAPN